MILEWLFMGALLAAAILPVALRSHSFAIRAGLLLLLAGGLAGIYWWETRLDQRVKSVAQLIVPHQERPGGYVSSVNCQSCHPDQYASWHRSYHRTMTQIPSPESMRGDFNNMQLTLDGYEYRLERRGEEFWVDMVDPDWKFEQVQKMEEYLRGQGPVPPAREANPPRVQKRISLMTGSHHMQAYWVPGKYGNQEFSFPFTFLFEQNRWVPRRDVFLKDPQASRLEQIWNVNCIGCHSTAGQPRQNTNTGIFDTRVAEFGIACEACHGPGETHLRLNANPRRRYDLHLAKKPDPSIVNPARLSAKKSSEVCGQCHGITKTPSADEWRQNGMEFHPGEDLETRATLMQYAKFAPSMRKGFFWNDGMVRVSGREYNGLSESPCFRGGDFSCLSCHSLHQSSPTNQLARGMESNLACLQCHKSFEKNLEQHTHHPAASSGSLCYNCHMPYTTYGLLKGLRSHQISNPNVGTHVKTGRPNACNLCHLDKTLDWTSRNLFEWYKITPENLSTDDQSVAASIVTALKGDAGQRALIVWHMGWKPAREISGDSWFAPFLAPMLEDPYSAVRYIAGRSLGRLPGFENFSYDYVGPSKDRQRARREAMERWSRHFQPVVNPTLLLGPDGRPDQPGIDTLLQSRNTRILELLNEITGNKSPASKGGKIIRRRSGSPGPAPSPHRLVGPFDFFDPWPGSGIAAWF